jgi:biofilm PGA synthesis N-glycosyltransferase PgaC
MELRCSIGIMAYNEEANIGKLLQALLRQKLTCCTLHEIVVVASGCTDKTIAITREYAERESKVNVLVQERREGKASAVNVFLKYAHAADVIVLESADTLPADDSTIDCLVRPLVEQAEVGMTGAQPAPVDTPEHFLGFVVHLQWKLHHRIAVISPKMGELVAFKNVLPEIPVDTAVDEACIEALLVLKGYGLRYIPEAVVYNKGPDTINDFLKQRRRIAAGHHHLRQTQCYRVSTQNCCQIIAALLAEMIWSPKYLLWTIGAIVLEAYGRFLGVFDFYVKKKNPFTWEMATTTKRLRE